MIVDKIKDLLRQENGEMNRFVAIKTFDKKNFITFWKYPIAGYDSIIYQKNN